MLTVNSSNHTGYGEWRGPFLAAGRGRRVIEGVSEEDGGGPPGSAVLSGYQGGEDGQAR